MRTAFSRIGAFTYHFLHEWLLQFLYEWSICATVFLVMALVLGFPESKYFLSETYGPLREIVLAAALMLPVSFFIVAWRYVKGKLFF